MANPARIDEWLIAHAQALDLRARVYNWPEALLPGYHDIGVTLSLYDRTFSGRAVDVTSDQAFVRAGAEALERVLCHEHGIGSNGVAVHSRFAQALSAATLELIERDRLLCHHLTSTPGEFLQPELSSFGRAIEELRQHRIKVHWRRLRPLAGIETVLCLAEGEAFVAIFGAAASRTLGEAADKAFFECMINVSAFLDGVLPARLSLAEFSRLKDPDPMDHIRLYLHPDSRHDVDKIYLAASPVADEAFDLSAIPSRQLAFRHPTLSDVPLVGACVTSADLQSLFWGVPGSEELNIVRLKRFKNADLNSFPHPVG